MSFTTSTDVFCDYCLAWTEGCTGFTGNVAREEAWKSAISKGWRLINFKHVCPSHPEIK